MPDVLPLHDEVRGRSLPTTVYVPAAGVGAPLIVFGHGSLGHPRKFTGLFERWSGAGYVVAAPAFPLTNDESPEAFRIEDVANQPADVSFVLDELGARGIGDRERIGAAGYSLGGETALAVALHPRHADRRIRAVAAIAGGLFHPEFAGDQLLAVPLLLVHGSEDTKRQRLEEALRVYGVAREPKELLLVEGGRHGICQDGDPEADVGLVAGATTDFWRRYL
jgi:predicted dienelactone hydrolase